MTIITSDTKYSDFNKDIQLLEAKRSTMYLNEAFSSMKFKTMSQYKQAYNIKQATRSIISDITLVRDATTNKVGKMSENTYIQHNLKVISRNQATLAPLFKKEAIGPTLDNFQLGYSYIQRAGANTIATQFPVQNYNADIYAQNLQKAIDIIQNLGPVKDEKKWLSNKQLEEIEEKAINIAVPRLLLFANILYHKQAPIIQGVMNGAGVVLNSVAKGMSGLSSKLFEWSDLVSNPFGQVINFMTGIGEVITASYSVLGQVAGGLFSVIGGGIANALFRDLDKDDKDSAKSSFIGTFMNVLSALSNILSGVFNLAFQAVQFSLQNFVTAITSILNIMKSIVKSSPVFEQILNYLMLQMSLFFLPFFSTFGEPLLSQVMSIFEWVVKTPTKLLQDFVDSTWTQEGTSDYISNILVSFDEIITQIQSGGLYDSMSSLINSLKEFMDAFMGSIINNQGKINDLLVAGVDTFNELVKRDILKDFIEMSTSGFKFIIDNQTEIFEIIGLVFEVSKAGLEVFSIQMSHFYSLMNMIFSGLGQLSGQVAGYRIWQIATLFSLGIQSIGLPVFIGVGQQVGGVVGEVSWMLLQDYIKQDRLDYYKSYKIPDQKNLPEFAHGGKIYRRNGGLFGIMAEATEAEYAIPKSKLNLFRGNNNLIIRINGKVYNEKQINQTVDELKHTMVLPFDTN